MWRTRLVYLLNSRAERERERERDRKREREREREREPQLVLNVQGKAELLY